MEVDGSPSDLLTVRGSVRRPATSLPLGTNSRDGDRGGHTDREQGDAGEHEGASDSDLLDGCCGDEGRDREGAGDAGLPEAEGLREVAIRYALLHEGDQGNVSQGGHEAGDREQESSKD